MGTRTGKWATAVAGLVLLGGCASEPEQPQNFASTAGPTAAEMQQGDVAGRTALVWRAPNADLKRYTRVIIDPVGIYQGPDANFGGADEAQLRELATYTQQEFTRAAGSRLARNPGPGVARVKLMLAGLENNTPVVAPVSRVAPAGLVMNLGKQALDQPGSFSGGVTIAGQVIDAQTNQPLVTFVQKRYPDAMNVVATFTSRGAQEAAIRQAAEAFKGRFEEIQKASGS
jgi:hypothetical protein